MSEQKIALVTGANRGLGKACVKHILKDGHIAILTSRNERKGQQAMDEVIKERGKENLHYFQLDVQSSQSIQKCMQQVKEKFGRLDWLINNAGYNYDTQQKAIDPDLEKCQKTMDINFFGPWRMTTAFLPLLRKSDSGRVVNVSSSSGQFSDMGGGTPAYSTSKSALNALTIKLAAELEDHNIKVNAVCPGWVATDMGGSEAPREHHEGADSILWAARIPDNGPTGGFFRDGERLELGDEESLTVSMSFGFLVIWSFGRLDI